MVFAANLSSVAPRICLFLTVSLCNSGSSLANTSQTKSLHSFSLSSNSSTMGHCSSRRSQLDPAQTSCLTSNTLSLQDVHLAKYTKVKVIMPESCVSVQDLQLPSYPGEKTSFLTCNTFFLQDVHLASYPEVKTFCPTRKKFSLQAVHLANHPGVKTPCLTHTKFPLQDVHLASYPGVEESFLTRKSIPLQDKLSRRPHA